MIRRVGLGFALAVVFALPVSGGEARKQGKRHHTKNLPDIVLEEVRQISWQNEINLYAGSALLNVQASLG